MHAMMTGAFGCDASNTDAQQFCATGVSNMCMAIF
jgi:hypothetical protein